MIRLAAILLSSTAVWCAGNPFTSPADVAEGRRNYQNHCAGCHGPGGEGGRGAPLASVTLSRAPDDAALFAVIKNGITGTEMPRAFELSDHETWQVAAFVRTLGRVAPEPVSGNPANGERLFRTSGCVQCHSVRRQGGRMGPDLSEIGARRSASYLRAVLLQPEASLPDGFMLVHVTTRDASRVTGILINEDTYSVQI